MRCCENSIYLLWVTIVTGGSRAAPAAGLGESLHRGFTVWLYLHPWKRQGFLGHWMGSAWAAPSAAPCCTCRAGVGFQCPVTQSVFQCGFPSTEPVPTLHLCTLGHRHRASTATSHQTPPLVFGPGTAGISWRGNFGETMMVRRGCSVGRTRGAVWAVLQAPAGTPREDKPRVGLAVEPPRHGFFLPEPWGCRQGLLSSHSHDRHHPTESPEPAWGALGPSCLGEKVLWIFSCCPGVTQTAGNTKPSNRRFYVRE